MNEMKALSTTAHQWLQEKYPSQWSKSHFSTIVKCDMLLDNLFESFNKFILDARDKLILTLMETLRTKLMQKIALKSKADEKFVGPFCPKIQKNLEHIILDSSRCWPKHVGGPKYQVACG
ncbi:hypothetical protein CRYUN_Cryun32bG0110200 [Craigia yunnanensis]